MALGALHEAGLSVPEDVVLIGLDDIEDARYATPSLSTIKPDKQHIGELAVSLLLKRIAGSQESPAERRNVPFQLIVRESTAERGKG